MNDVELSQLAHEIMEDIDPQILNIKADKDSTDTFILELVEEYCNEMDGAYSSHSDDIISNQNHSFQSHGSLPELYQRHQMKHTVSPIPDFTSKHNHQKQLRHSSPENSVITTPQSLPIGVVQSNIQNDNEYAVETEYGFLYVKY
eukprot:155097_1